MLLFFFFFFSKFWLLDGEDREAAPVGHVHMIITNDDVSLVLCQHCGRYVPCGTTEGGMPGTEFEHVEETAASAFAMAPAGREGARGVLTSFCIQTP